MGTIQRRDWLKQSTLAAFGLGISLKSLANEEGLPRNFGSEKGLINLGSNENPYGFSSNSRQAILDMLSQGNRYQFNIPLLKDYRKQIAQKYGLAEDNMVITAGSGEALNLFARYYSNGNIVSANPTFGILPNTAKRLGVQVKEIPLTYDKVHDLPAMLAAIDDKTSLVYICNPANPTATILSPSALKDFCQEASKKATVLIDEAYIDYIKPPDNESMLSLISENPNILVMRTFSKIHGMAGLRIGFTAAHPATIRKLQENLFASTHFCTSVLSLTAAIESLNDLDHQRSSRVKNEAARQFTYDELTKLKYRVIPSSTNFMVFDLKNYAGDFSADMLKKNIVLRSMTYPDGKWCRVSVGTMDEMKQFVNVMKSI